MGERSSRGLTLKVTVRLNTNLANLLKYWTVKFFVSWLNLKLLGSKSVGNLQI